MSWRAALDPRQDMVSIQDPETHPQARPSAQPRRPSSYLRPRLPLVTFGLIGANLLMAFVQWAASGFPLTFPDYSTDLADWALGAKVPSLIAHGEYWRLITANFLHGSVFHLLFNLLGILVLGRLVELFYGRLRLLVIYTLSAVAGAVLSYLTTQSVSLGASTAVMGLLTATVFHNWKYRRYLPDRVNAIYPALLVILAFQLVMDLLSPGIVDGAGHLGGALGGFAVASLLESRVAGPSQSERDWLPLPTAVATAVLLLGYGAYGLLSSLPSHMGLLRAAQSANPEVRRALLEQSLERRPYFLEARFRLAVERAASGDAAGAREIFFNMVRADPALRETSMGRDLRNLIALAYFRTAHQAYEKGEYEVSLALHRDALAVEPTRPAILAEAHNGYAWTLAEKLNRNYKEAEEHAKKALEVQPKAAHITDTLAWVYYKQGRHQEALKTQLEAVDLMKKSGPRSEAAEYYYHLGAIYEKLGNREAAGANYREALALQTGFAQAEDGLRRVTPRLPPPRRPQMPVIPQQPRRLSPVEERGLI